MITPRIMQAEYLVKYMKILTSPPFYTRSTQVFILSHSTMKPNFLLSSLAVATLSQAAQVTYDNNRRFLFDVDGNQIDAYGSKVNRRYL